MRITSFFSSDTYAWTTKRSDEEEREQSLHTSCLDDEERVFESFLDEKINE